MVDYDKLKKDTYLFLISDKNDAKSLVYASLLISLCHDKCIKDDKLMVEEEFIKKCNTLIPFEDNYEEMEKLSDIEKFSLIRNKLAHGDFVYKEDSQELYFKYNVLGKELISKIKLCNVIKFANEIVNYYDYLDGELVRERIVINNGFKMVFRDVLKTGGHRTLKYNDFINTVMEEAMKYVQTFPTDQKKFDCFKMPLFTVCSGRCLASRKGKLELSVSYTDEDDKVINNPYKNILEDELLKKINGFDTENDEVISLLGKLYLIFVYPLENFLKGDDRNVQSLQNGIMFDFSLLNISANNPVVNVSKIEQYNDDLYRAYTNLGKYHDKLEKLKGYHGNTNKKVLEDITGIQEEIDKLTDLFCNNSIKLIYSYSKNRSIVEHLRCALMHGNYSYNDVDETFTFEDYWKGERQFSEIIHIKDFRNIFNNENFRHIFGHFQEVYSNSKKK